MPKLPSAPRGIAIILSVAAVIAFCIYWDTSLRHDFFPRNWGMIENGVLFRSGQLSPALIERTLAEHHIKTILFMSGDKVWQPDIAAELSATKKLGIERLNLPLGGDGTGPVHYYATAVSIMAKNAKAGVPTLVHCHTGSQRTGGAVVYYRIFVDGWTGQQAYDELIAYGHNPHSNPELVPYLNTNMAWMAQRLVDLGVIGKAPSPLPVVGP